MVKSELKISSYKREISVFVLINMAIIYFIYGLCLHEHFSVDTYGHIVPHSVQRLLEISFGDGRYLAGLLIRFLDWLGIRSGTHQHITVGSLMVAMALSSGVFSGIIYRNCTDKQVSVVKAIAVDCAVLLTFINPFITEWYLFPGTSIVMGFAVFAALAACMITYFCRGAVGFVLAAAVLYAGLSLYQVILGIYVVFAIMLEISRKGAEWTKGNICYVMKVVAIGISASLLSVLIVKWINPALGMTINHRAATFSYHDIRNNIHHIFEIQPWIWTTGLDTMRYNMLPRVFYALMLLAAAAAVESGIKRKKNVISTLAFDGLYAAGALFMAFAPLLITSSFYYAHRIVAPLMAAFSVLGCLIVIHKPGKVILNIAAGVMFVFLCICSFRSQYIQNNAFVNNALDEQAIRYVEKEIREYEKDTGIQVTKIGFASDTNGQLNYPGISFNSIDIGRTVRAVEWGFVNAVSYYTGRSFTQVEMDQSIYDQYFAGKDYDLFDEEQMVFVEDTVYILQY